MLFLCDIIESYISYRIVNLIPQKKNEISVLSDDGGVTVLKTYQRSYNHLINEQADDDLFHKVSSR